MSGVHVTFYPLDQPKPPYTNAQCRFDTPYIHVHTSITLIQHDVNWQHDLVLFEHMMRDWTTRRDDIRNRLLPEARGLELFCSNEFIYDWEFQVCHWELDVKRLIDLLAKECDSKSRSLPRLEQLLRERLELARLDDALRNEVVASDRGSRKPNRDDIFLRLDNGDKLNYCITPQPIPRVDWGLFVAERKLVVLKLRRAELSYVCDDLLSMICLKLDDVFYVRTRDERALTVRDLSEGKIKMPDPPGMQIRKHLFFERDD